MHITRPTKTIQDYVAAFNMTAFLNDNLLSELQLFHFPPYNSVYIEQDKQHYFYFLVEGQVQCYHYHLNGKLAVFALSEPFSAIGDVEILSDDPVKSNVISTRDTVMLGIASEYVERYGEEDPRFLRFLIDQLRSKLYTASELLANHVLPVLNRVAVYMLAQQPVDAAGGIILPEKEQLASLLGTTPRHLNRVLKELVDAGHINAGYPLVRILNRAALEDLS